MKIYASHEAAAADGVEHIFKDGANEFRGYPYGEIARPEPVVDTRTELVKEIDASPLLDALVGEMAKLKTLSKADFIGSLEASTKEPVIADVVPTKNVSAVRSLLGRLGF